MTSRAPKRPLESPKGPPNKIPRLGSLGVQDTPIFLAQDEEIQEIFSTVPVPFAIKWEVARLGKEHYDRIRSELAAYIDMSNYGAFAQFEHDQDKSTLLSEKEKAAISPWTELDQEELAFKQDADYGGIGNNSAFPDWYGGKVDLRGTLQKNMSIKLEMCTLGPSNKAKRRFGSKSFIRIKIPDNLRFHQNTDFVSFFKHPFVFWGSVFRAFYAKDDSVFLYLTNETYENGAFKKHPERLPLYSFVEWANPPELNKNQKACKWSSRMALILSNSVPGPRLLQPNISTIPDIISISDSKEESNMTDGCGVANLALQKVIRDQIGLQEIPTAFQCRVAGGKGMLLLDRNWLCNSPSLSLRNPSQIKIQYIRATEAMDPSHLTLDLLRFAQVKTPGRLSAEVIINLEYNGVPAQHFVDLSKQAMTDLVTSLTTWEGKDAMFNLWRSVERTECVVSARRSRESVTDGRLKGFMDLKEDDMKDDENADNDKTDQHSSAWWPDPVSGCPSSLAETVMTVLDAGFMPQGCPYLMDKLKQVLKYQINHLMNKFRFEIEQSATAFAVPDIYGVLGPDEIHFKSSRREFLTPDGHYDLIIGDVLITRSPCKVPSDVKAVSHPDLSGLVDVVVCSVTGPRRLLDYLGTGDYDGDRVTVIWDQVLVKPYENANDEFSLPPAGLDDCFELQDEMVSDILNNSRRSDRTDRLQNYLLGSLRTPSIVGEMSSCHDRAVYYEGYGHPEAHKLAYVTTTVLDGAKSGHKIKADVQKTYKTKYDKEECPLRWKEERKVDQRDKQQFVSHSNRVVHLRKRPKELGPFIMDTIQETTLKDGREWLLKAEKEFFRTSSIKPDEDLLEPYKYVKRVADERQDANYLSDLELIAKHVRSVYRKYSQKKGTSFSNKHIVHRQDDLRSCSKEFASFPKPEDLKTIMDNATIARLRASYAYHFDVFEREPERSVRWSRFPWDMALRELCAIKVRALGPWKASTQSFYERFKLAKNW
ncbi:hypothetical protein D9758_007515 [Tetrapyrgos nigripes]|uniref:RNA-dependent RNA polymerase n=1 Tax=Tetrapyrgos nigripes TaxID=182062 RepID=A0A8H5LHI2_9AGAR|nr:hypothetical protein D9758_007515 [Tetrapyrgos nigripes]